MKRLAIFVVFIVSILVVGFSTAVFSEANPDEITVQLDGLPVTFDSPPALINNRTMVPFRAIAEALNVKVDWNSAEKKVEAQNGEIYVKLYIGNKTAYCGNKAVNLDTEPITVKGRTLIPLRFFSEAFDCKVEWDSKNNCVRITSPIKAMNVSGFYALGDSKTSSWKNLFGKDYPETNTGNTNLISNLALGWYSLDLDGTLLTKSTTGWQRPEGWEKVLDAAEEYKINTEMVVHMTDKDNIITNMLKDEAAVERAVDAIAEEAVKFDGVNLDFEGLGLKDTGEQLNAVRDSFSRFAEKLNKRLTDNGLTLTLTLHAPNSAYKGYDYSELGKNCSSIIIMAYDYGTKPEPVEKVIQAVEQAGAVVPAEKLVLGISAPSETAESIAEKIGIAKRYNLNGIALWRIGLVPEDMWSAIQASAKANK